ncbi:Xaa-Pro peptidase family protein [Chloroflexi bacterium TSY]|nr:Xaa-Pro peptidase family protein [Chloroflexi bacterium TSY]
MNGYTGLPVEQFHQRVETIRGQIVARGLDALFAFSDEYRPGSTLYLSDYHPINVIEESPQGVYVPVDGDVVLFLGAINAKTAAGISWIEDIRPVDELNAFFLEQNGRKGRKLRVGLVGEALLPVKYYRRSRLALADSDFVYADDLLNKMRSVKSSAEIALMEKAAQLGDAGIIAAVERLKEGPISEIELAATAEHVVRMGGAELGSATILSSGINTQKPTWRATDKPIELGDPVLIDVNPFYRGYCSDVSITVFREDDAFRISDEQRGLLDFSRQTLRGVVESMVPGRPAHVIYDYFLAQSRAAGYESYFTLYAKGMRAVGHGVGVNVVEWPNLDADSSFLLEPGMTLAVKFDLHGFDFGGTRFEIDVVVEEQGSRALNRILDHEI